MWDLAISLSFYLLLYTALIVVMVFLMLRAIKHGPTETSLLDLGEETPQATILEPAQ